jgi:hypothetical protein
MEGFVGRVFQGGKVTVPKWARDLLCVEDGDYVRVAVLEVVKRRGAVGGEGHASQHKQAQEGREL